MLHQPSDALVALSVGHRSGGEVAEVWGGEKKREEEKRWERKEGRNNKEGEREREGKERGERGRAGR